MTDINKLADKAASTVMNQTAPRKKKKKIPWWLAAPTGLGAATGLGLAYGMGGDAHAKTVQNAIGKHNTPLEPNETYLSRYTSMLSPGANTKLLGRPVGELLALGRSSPAVLKAFGADPGYAATNPGSWHDAKVHYLEFGKGPIAAYSHMMHPNKMMNRAEYNVDLGGGKTAPYTEVMGKKFKEFWNKFRDPNSGYAGLKGNANWLEPHDVDTTMVPYEDQVKFLKDFHASLPPELRALKEKVENDPTVKTLPDGQTWKGTKPALEDNLKNYLPITRGALKTRDILKTVGMTSAGAGLGGLLGHYLYDDEDEDASTLGYLASTLGGAGLGGAVGYLGGTEQGRQTMSNAANRLAGLFKKQSSVKAARNIGLSSVRDITEGGRGPMMEHALNLLMQARAMARPTDEDLKIYGTTRPEFEQALNRIVNANKGANPQDKLDVTSVKVKPKSRALGYGLAAGIPSALLGYQQKGLGGALAAGLLGGGAAGLYGASSAGSENKQNLAAAKALRDYGILTPGSLNKVMPLLSDKTAAEKCDCCGKSPCACPPNCSCGCKNKTMDKKAFIAWGGGQLGLHPKGRGIGGEIGYTNLLGVLPIPVGGIDMGGPQKGFQMGVSADPTSDFGISPYLGFRWNHPRRTGLTRSFPRGLIEILYDKARGRTKQDAIRASYPELYETKPKEKAEPKNNKERENKKEKTEVKEKEKAAAAKPGLWANIHAKKERGETPAKPGDKDYPTAKNWKKVTQESEKKASPAWQTSEGKSESGGLNDKGRASLKAQGHDIKRPQPEGGPRKDSFCARMKGMKSKLTSSETARDPDSRINKALRKWKCGSAAEKLAFLSNVAANTLGRAIEGPKKEKGLGVKIQFGSSNNSFGG